MAKVFLIVALVFTGAIVGYKLGVSDLSAWSECRDLDHNRRCGEYFDIDGDGVCSGCFFPTVLWKLVVGP